jgi:alanine racemase
VIGPRQDVPTRYRPTVLHVDLSAITANVRAIARLVSPAQVCAVVKADGYGHGSVEAAQAALEGGASLLAVALVEEAQVLRAAGFDTPILLLSEPPMDAAEAVLALHVTPTVYSLAKVHELAEAASLRGFGKSNSVSAAGLVDVHIKVDTGMHRVGVQPADLVALARAIADSGCLRLAGTFTHFAIADAPDNAFTHRQLDLFETCLSDLRAHGIDPGIVHAGNSAGAIAHTRARFDMVRLGVAMYGNTPDAGFDCAAYGVNLTPVLRLCSQVSHVKVLSAGERVSYGLTYTVPEDRVIATVPVGYADGVPRRLSAVGGQVIIGGQRHPIVGRITMDQLLVDCGPPCLGDSTQPISKVSVGDEVVLLGQQGDQAVQPWEWAIRLETIAYEITCGISKRVPRSYDRNYEQVELSSSANGDDVPSR